jgi:hypothetical protein
VVAVRFSGRWTDERFEEHEDLATRWCESRGYVVSGPAVRARYNPPFTPWFMRRNEILLPVRDGSEPHRP